MSGCFLDTTIVIELADGAAATSKWAAGIVASNQPAQVPFYAFRELLTGRLRLLCDAHNRLVASENAAEALLSISRLPGKAGRKKEGPLHAILEALHRAFDGNPSGGRLDLKREILQDLSIKIALLWKRSQSLESVKAVQELSCFNGGNLTRQAGGQVVGPRESFNCLKEKKCAAAAYVHDNKAVLQALIDALHPDNLPESRRNSENASRRKALKHLLAVGPKEFHKNYCRALGDAYFAAMCPAPMAVVTTNKGDFAPLCEAIGKAVLAPP